jgi:Family of unknown function (DUF6077)
VEPAVPREPVVRRVGDAVLDSAVVSFALWTLLYCLGLATQWRLYVSGWLWLVASVAFLGWSVARVVRDHRAASADPPGGPGAEASVRNLLPLLAVGVVATVGAAIGGLVWTPGVFKLTWLATVVAIAALLGWSWFSRRLTLAPGGTDEDGSPPPWADWSVLGLAAAVGVLSLFVHLADTDDPYYVNRSVWVAEHGNAALRDTMFSPEVFNTPYGGGIPIASIEALLGVVAHMAGIRAGAATYLIATPVGSALSVWALWRLARAWAPRRAFLVLLGSVAFLMLSGDSMLGNFWIPRMWQGKVMAATILIPLIWAYLSEVVEVRSFAERRRLLLLLLASGVAFFGLTPTAVVWAPLMFGAVLLAALVLRNRMLAVGGGLMLLGPLLSGAAVVVFSEDVGGKEPVALPSYDSFVRILGDREPMVALGLVALCLAPVLARRGVAATLAGTSALTAVLAFAPGVLPLINSVTGSGPILWRMLLIAPIPVLVGLLAAQPWPTGRLRTVLPSERVARVAGAVVAAVLVLGLVAGGRPIWAYTGHGTAGGVTVTSSPEWKLDLAALRDVRALDRRGMEGVVLLPPPRMKVLTMFTTDAFPVVPREWFIGNIEEPLADRRARRLLFDVAAGRPPLPTKEKVQAALERLDVTLACVGDVPKRQQVLELYGGEGDPERIGSLACVTTPVS